VYPGEDLNGQDEGKYADRENYHDRPAVRQDRRPRTITLLPLATDAKRPKPVAITSDSFSLYRDGMSVDEYVKGRRAAHDVERDEKAGRISVGT
jgi:hypothetical protein